MLMILALLFSSVCSTFKSDSMQVHMGKAQGTTYTIRYVATKPFVLQSELDSVFRVIDQSLSLYVPSSRINVFNRLGMVVMDEHLKKVIMASLDCYRESGGAFDITSATISSLWGFGVKAGYRVPRRKEIRRAMKLTGSDLLRVKGDTLLALKRGVRIDCNGIAQGYTVDVLMGFLQKKGLKHCLVELGGEIRVVGEHPKTGDWTIGIESAESLADGWHPVQQMVKLRNKAITSSAGYRKTFRYQGLSYSHIIDPRLGRPVRNGHVSVTVIADDALTADAWDNVFMVLSLDAAIELLQRRRDLKVYIVYQEADNLKTFVN